MDTTKSIITRSQAKELGLRRYYTGKPCVRGHVVERFTSTGQCLTCVNSQTQSWRKENPEKAAKAQAEWRARQPKKPKTPRARKTSQEINRKYRLKKRGFPNANLDVVCIPIDPKVRWAIYYDAKKARISEKQLEYRQRNKEALKRAWDEWYANNRVSQIEKATMRRGKVLNATPLWLTSDQRKAISAVYFESIKLSEETGIPHHVDHIVPISGKTVCGLHVPWNLRAIPANENLKKGNKLLSHA